MTHEFKTPIATMSLVLDSLKTIGSNNNNPEKILHYVEILKQEKRVRKRSSTAQSEDPAE